MLRLVMCVCVKTFIPYPQGRLETNFLGSTIVHLHAWRAISQGGPAHQLHACSQAFQPTRSRTTERNMTMCRLERHVRQVGRAVSKIPSTKFCLIEQSVVSVLLEVVPYDSTRRVIMLREPLNLAVRTARWLAPASWRGHHIVWSVIATLCCARYVACVDDIVMEALVTLEDGEQAYLLRAVAEWYQRFIERSLTSRDVLWFDDLAMLPSAFKCVCTALSAHVPHTLDRSPPSGFVGPSLGQSSSRSWQVQPGPSLETADLHFRVVHMELQVQRSNIIRD